ncbi:MAG: ABC-2 transporter permease [Clostridia bacterium]|nr:ABC-2 transporter permease [Clostridia bacterium]
MLGLIKKDFLLIKSNSNLKTIIIMFIIYIMMAFQGMFEVTFIVPLIGIIMFITTFSYDDYNNWNSYAVTLPNGRKNVVKAKYIASIILIIMLGILSLVISMGIDYVKTNSINLAESTSALIETILSTIIIISFLYPIVFKFGATNGRIILFIVVFTVVGIVTLITKFVDMSIVINTINELDKYPYIAIPIICVILLSISYLISNKIYQSKEF